MLNFLWLNDEVPCLFFQGCGGQKGCEGPQLKGAAWVGSQPHLDHCSVKGKKTHTGCY